MMRYSTFVYIFLFTWLVSACSAQQKVSKVNGGSPEQKAQARIAEIEQADKVVWLTFDEAQELSKHQPKKIFVDVYTTWCGWCKKMDGTTLQDPNISKYLNKHYYSVKLNAESSKKLTYNGKEMSEADLAKNVFQATGYPTTVYLNEEQKVIQPVPGYLDVDLLNKILHFYGEDHYKTTTWDRFRLNFNSEN